jgi:hypothetical protein
MITTKFEVDRADNYLFHRWGAEVAGLSALGGVDHYEVQVLSDHQDGRGNVIERADLQWIQPIFHAHGGGHFCRGVVCPTAFEGGARWPMLDLQQWAADLTFRLSVKITEPGNWLSVQSSASDATMVGGANTTGALAYVNDCVDPGSFDHSAPGRNSARTVLYRGWGVAHEPRAFLNRRGFRRERKHCARVGRRLWWRRCG